MSANGKLLSDKDQNDVIIIFGTDDPGVCMKVSDRVLSTGNEIYLRMSMTYLPKETAELIEKELKKKIRL